MEGLVMGCSRPECEGVYRCAHDWERIVSTARNDGCRQDRFEVWRKIDEYAVARDGDPKRGMPSPATARKRIKEQGKRNLDDAVAAKQPGSAAGGQLNPTWVEWLMGWPLGWTDCAPLETAKFLPWLHSHGGR